VTTLPLPLLREIMQNVFWFLSNVGQTNESEINNNRVMQVVRKAFKT
jgi:hypothetical protein